MFEGVKTKFPLLLPILKPEYVVERIVDSIEHRDTHLGKLTIFNTKKNKK